MLHTHLYQDSILINTFITVLSPLKLSTLDPQRTKIGDTSHVVYAMQSILYVSSTQPVTSLTSNIPCVSWSYWHTQYCMCCRYYVRLLNQIQQESKGVGGRYEVTAVQTHNMQALTFWHDQVHNNNNNVLLVPNISRLRKRDVGPTRQMLKVTVPSGSPPTDVNNGHVPPI